MIRGNAARAPKTAAAIAAIAAGMLLLAGILAYAPWDGEHRHPGDWPLEVLPALLGDAFAHVFEPLSLVATDSILTNHIDLPKSIRVFELDDHTYAAVAGAGSVQFLNLSDTSDVTLLGRVVGTTGGVSDSFTISGSTYIVKTVDDALSGSIQIINITNPSSITTAGSTTNSQLNLARGIDVFELGGDTWAAVAADAASRVVTLNLTNPSSPTIADSIADTDSLELSEPYDIDVFKLGDDTWAAVAAKADDGVQILNLTDPADIAAAGSIGSSTTLNGARSISVFKLGGDTWAAVAADDANRVTILNLTSPTNPKYAGTIMDTDSLELRGPHSIDVFKLGGDTYAAVAAYDDHGVQILNLNNPASPTAVVNLNDTGSLELEGASAIVTFELPGSTYAAVAADTGADPGSVQILRMDANTNSPPAVDAGRNQAVHEDTTVSLQGTATDSDNDPMTYLWTHSPSTPAITFSDATVLDPTFTAPDVPGSGSFVYILTLNATDHHGASTTDTKQLVVFGNSRPDVDAGPDQTVREGDVVQLSGTATDRNNDPVTYQWTYSPSTPAIALSNSATLTPAFTAPEVSANTTYTFTLNATDHHGASSTDTVGINVQDNQPPTVELDDTLYVNEHSRVTIAGNVDDPEGDHPLSYHWKYTRFSGDGEPINFGDTSSDTVTFIAPSVTTQTVYKIYLTVTDSRGASDYDILVMTVDDVANNPPTADAGRDRAVDGGDQITLTGKADDPEGEAMTYTWTCRADSRQTINAGTTKSVTFTAPEVSSGDVDYTCTFTATDPHGLIGSDTMTLTVRAPPEDGPVLTVAGHRTPTVTQGSSWTDPGATCATLFDGSPLPVTTSIYSVRLSGQGWIDRSDKLASVDTGVVGHYLIEYSCSHNGRDAAGSRIVGVKSGNESPKIAVVSVRTEIGAGDAATDYSSDANCVDREDGGLAVTSSVAISGQTATITYTCTDSGGQTATISQEVAVLSSSPPEIHLEGASPYYLTVDDTWEDPGATCTDAEDGTFDADVIGDAVDTTAAGHYTVSYQCTDLDGNIDTIVRNVFVNPSDQDLPPVLTVSDDLTINVNATWSMPEATCTDKEDGDLTDQIWTWSEEDVDTSKAGTYRITYFCTDSADNETQATIKVVVKEGS